MATLLMLGLLGSLVPPVLALRMLWRIPKAGRMRLAA